jgi:hypothetical protein
MKHPFPLIFAGAILLFGVAEAAAQGQSSFPSADYSSQPATQPGTQPATPAPARTAANATPNGSGTMIPNGPVTSDPPGAGASSSATLADHGETPERMGNGH